MLRKNELRKNKIIRTLKSEKTNLVQQNSNYKNNIKLKLLIIHYLKY